MGLIIEYFAPISIYDMILCQNVFVSVFLLIA